MNNNDQRIRLLRDVEANMVPSGDKVTLAEGNLVQITQSLGGNHTVIINGNMAQISAEDADALGLKIEEKQTYKPNSDFSEQLVWDQLKTCYDPEIPVNIYELGLIYDIAVDNKNISVKMTLTTPNCPVAESLPKEVKDSIMQLEEVDKVDLDLVWEPPWDKSMMSEAAKLELNL